MTTPATSPSPRPTPVPPVPPVTPATASPPASATLAPYAGPFGRAEAWHLLRRSCFGARAAWVDEAVGLGLAGALDRISAREAPMPPPVNHDFPDDPNVAIGETWVRAPYSRERDLHPYRYRSMMTWVNRHFVEAGMSLERRLMLFFVNHFGANADTDARMAFGWYELMRGAWRMSFPELIEAVTVHPTMLTFLDGRDNRASSPNENYARELLELFTVGKGAAVGPGDYTHYTEGDIRELARALTGWRVRHHWSDRPDVTPEAYFDPDRHDAGVKRLSPRLGGLTIEDAGEREYAAVVAAIFAQPAVGTYVCRKLYRWFCHYEVTDEVEAQVVAPMAAAFRDSGYDFLAPVLLLLGSAHFYEARFRGALAKSPLDELCDLTAGLGLAVPASLTDQLWMYGTFDYFCGVQGMPLLTPPSVAGFKAYHQAPLYNRYWINAATLQSRAGHAGWSIWTSYRREDGARFPLDHLGYVATFEDPNDPNAVVRELAERLLPTPLSEAQLAALKESLIPGLPDFEWTIEYGQHLDDPSDENIRMAVSARIQRVLWVLVNSADFRLY